MARRLSLHKKLAFSMCVGLLAFLVCEIFVRTTHPRTDLWGLTGRSPTGHAMESWAQLDAFCAYRGRPGTYGSEEDAKTVNEHGFISTPSLTVEKPAGVTRVLFLGGSSTAGTAPNLPGRRATADLPGSGATANLTTSTTGGAGRNRTACTRPGEVELGDVANPGEQRDGCDPNVTAIG